MDEGGASFVPPSGRAGCHFGAVCIFCTFPADELSDQKRSRSPDFKGHQQLLAWHVSVFSWLHRDSGAAALHFCAYGTDENLAVFSDGIWVLATVLGIITTVLKDTLPITDLVQNSLMILPIMIVVQAIMLPFQLKFGGDKGRIAMIGAFGGLAVITLVIVKGAEAIFNIDLVSLLDNLPTVSMGVLIAIAIIIALLMLLVSMKISLSIMNKKEF